MHPLLDVIRDLKLQAKNQRDRGFAGYPRAVKRATEAIAQLEQAMAQTSVPEARLPLAKELADCHGLVGGVERRWALEGPAQERESHLIRSVAEYDSGHCYESDPQYGIINSYNLVNRLTSRILLHPDILTSAGLFDLGHGLRPIDLPLELQTAVTAIREQLAGPRKGDYWAMADLGLLEVLLDLAPPRVAYASFLSVRHEVFTIASVLDGLQPLADLPIKVAPALQEAARLVRDQSR